ncbi:MAG: undecaprenyl-phosphate glucose phosphotransferase [Geminicoccaceae bacterium]
MRAELPALATGGTRLSPSSARVLVEILVRVGDLLAIAAAGILTAWWRFPAGPEPASALTAFLTVCLLAPQVLAWFCDYAGPRLLLLGWQLPRLLAGWLAAVALAIMFLFAFKLTDEVSRLWLGLWLVGGAVALVGVRLGLRWALGDALVARVLSRRLAVIGLGEELPRALDRLATPGPGLAGPLTRIACALDLDGSLHGRWPRGVGRLAGFAELEERVRDGKVDQIVLAMPPRSGELVGRTLRNLRHLGVDVGWVPGLPGGHLPVLGTAQIGDVPMLRLLERPLDGWRWLLKGVEDRVLAALLLVLLAPLLLLIALAVRLDTPGPVFYRQRRHGFSQQPITMLKFRTMHAALCDPVDARSVRQASRGDPRVTRIGRFLRRTSLDELPQLINVLRGDMSLVGPRPHAVAHDRLYAEEIDGYLGRHRVKPGITGWAQVNGCRGETRTTAEMRRRIELDLEYIDHWSLWFDLRILVRTVLVGFRQEAAY